MSLSTSNRLRTPIFMLQSAISAIWDILENWKFSKSFGKKSKISKYSKIPQPLKSTVDSRIQKPEKKRRLTQRFFGISRDWGVGWRSELVRSKGMRFWGALGCAWGVVQALAHICTRLKKIGEKWKLKKIFFPTFQKKKWQNVPYGCMYGAVALGC